MLLPFIVRCNSDGIDRLVPVLFDEALGLDPQRAIVTLEVGANLRGSLHESVEGVLIFRLLHHVFLVDSELFKLVLRKFIHG